MSIKPNKNQSLCEEQRAFEQGTPDGIEEPKVCNGLSLNTEAIEVIRRLEPFCLRKKRARLNKV